MSVSRKPVRIASWQRAPLGANLQQPAGGRATRAARQYKLLPMSAPSAPHSLLESIGTPADLRRLPIAKLTELAQELREILIHSVSTRGGPFAAGLGTVEL